MDFEQYTAPPCVRLGVPLNHCAKQRFGEQLLNHIELVQEWQGWRFRGRDLVSPDGLRICPQRLRGFLYMEKIERLRRSAMTQKSSSFEKSIKTAQIFELNKS